ncbi:MAG: hypothetical protein RI556_04635 [Hydrogenovibrio sp.]|nr:MULTISPECIES: hypothetical protein [Hydrogenovibrio]MDR9498439.1 hypothetical protein [Hydrogenovibrio sp.]
MWQGENGFVLAATGIAVLVMLVQLWWPWRCASRLRQRLEAASCD